MANTRIHVQLGLVEYMANTRIHVQLGLVESIWLVLGYMYN